MDYVCKAGPFLGPLLQRRQFSQFKEIWSILVLSDTSGAASAQEGELGVLGQLKPILPLCRECVSDVHWKWSAFIERFYCLDDHSTHFTVPFLSFIMCSTVSMRTAQSSRAIWGSVSLWLEDDLLYPLNHSRPNVKLWMMVPGLAEVRTYWCAECGWRGRQAGRLLADKESSSNIS